MPIFYRGAGVGTYWHKNDARATGFVAHSPLVPASADRLVNHIARGTTFSPYVSLTASYAVGSSYASSGTTLPTRRHPGYVYEIQIDEAIPAGLTLIEPIRDIANAFWSPTCRTRFHHDGTPKFLLGVLDPAGHASHLTAPCVLPPAGNTITKAPVLFPELQALVWALRDSEVLVLGGIPRANVITRYDVY